MKAPSFLLTIALSLAALSNCAPHQPSAVNERLSQESIASATVGKRPGSLDRVRRHMLR